MLAPGLLLAAGRGQHIPLYGNYQFAVAGRPCEQSCAEAAAQAARAGQVL